MSGSGERSTTSAAPISDPDESAEADEEDEETNLQIPESQQQMDHPLDLSVRKRPRGSDYSNDPQSRRENSNRSGEVHPAKRQKMTEFGTGIAHASTSSDQRDNYIPRTAPSLYCPEQRFQGQLIPPSQPIATASGRHAGFQAAYFPNQEFQKQYSRNPEFWTQHEAEGKQNHLMPFQVPRGNPGAETARSSQNASKDDYSLQCPHCVDKLSSAKNLRKHIYRKHKDLHFCMVYYCGREFGTPKQLEDHLEQDHETDRDKVLKTEIVDKKRKTFTVCPFCVRSFAATGVQTHILDCGRLLTSTIHKCELHIPCNMYFKSEAEKEKHDETVHKKKP